MKPYFEVRNLAEYSCQDLHQLLVATQSSQRWAKEWGREDDAKILDVWCYRIKDALSQAKKRESDNSTTK